VVFGDEDEGNHVTEGKVKGEGGNGGAKKKLKCKDAWPHDAKRTRGGARLDRWRAQSPAESEAARGPVLVGLKSGTRIAPERQTRRSGLITPWGGVGQPTGADTCRKRKRVTQAFGEEERE